MRNFKAIYVPLIAIFPWIIYPVAWFFLSIKPMREEWDKQFQARNSSRGTYNSGTDFKGNWPPDDADQANLKPRQQAGLDDKNNDQQSFEQTKKSKEEELAAKKVERDQHKVLLDALLNRYMKDLPRSKYDYDKPDEFMFTLLKTQRDEEGPRLYKFLHKAYPNLYFALDATLPPPPLQLRSGILPQPGTQGRLPWPVGKGRMSLTVFGLYKDLLNFIETFGDRYDRIVYLTGCDLQRVAFDHTGTVLMRLNTNFEMFIWPEHAPVAGGGGPPGGGPGPEGDVAAGPPGEAPPPGDAPPPADAPPPE